MTAAPAATVQTTPEAPRARLGWAEIGVAVPAYLVLTVAAGFGLYGLSDPDSHTGTTIVVLALALSAVATTGAAFLAVLVRIRSAAALGLRSTSWGWVAGGLALGLLVFLANRLVVLGFIWLTGDAGNPQADLANAAASGGLGLAAMLLAGAMLVPFAEELLFRGVLYGALRRYGMWIATVASALLFGLAHGFSFVLPAAFVLGLVAAVVYERSGSIWPAVAVHAANNAAAFAVAAILL